MEFPLSITVAKFGGTSVADFTAMTNSAKIVENNPDTRLIIISACSGVTNHLVELANGICDPKDRDEKLHIIKNIHYSILEDLKDASQVQPQIDRILGDIATFAYEASQAPSIKITDKLVACGELMSTYLFTEVLNERGNNAVRFDIRQVMKTDSSYGCALPNIEAIETQAQALLAPICQDHLVVSQGFIGSDDEGNTTTLGRGGSDYSAALVAEGVHAGCLQIWTDVPGIYTTDPRIAPEAYAIPEISFTEASEMANFGAKILHPATLIPAVRKQIPVFVGSSKDPAAGGTWVRNEAKTSPLFRALALRKNQTMVTLHSLSMYQTYGFLADVFAILAKYKVSVDLISTSEVSVALTLDQTDTCGGAPQLPKAAMDELSKLCTVDVEYNLSVVALIGNNMRNTKGAGKDIFNVLEDYNIRMICYGASTHNLCFLVNSDRAPDVVRASHDSLFVQPIA